MLCITDQQLRANTYLAPTRVPGEVVVIDPGLDTEAIAAALQRAQLRPVAVACTHGHFDHIASAHELQREYGAPVLLHRDDHRLARSANFLMMACRIERRMTLPRMDLLVQDGTEIEVGGEPLRFIHVPGHTAGSCLITFRDSIFTGDTIYRNGVGRCDFPGEDAAQLRSSILGVWDRLDQRAWARPGHGASGRWGAVRAENGPLRDFLGLETEAAA